MSARTKDEDRNAFHAWLISQGYRPDISPMTPNGSYPSSHVQELWDCWRAAIKSTGAPS